MAAEIPSPNLAQRAQFHLCYDRKTGMTVADKLMQFCGGKRTELRFFCTHCPKSGRGVAGKTFKCFKTVNGVLKHIRREHTGTQDVEQQNAAIAAMRVTIKVFPETPNHVHYSIESSSPNPPTNKVELGASGAAGFEDEVDEQMSVPDSDHSSMEGITDASVVDAFNRVVICAPCTLPGDQPASLDAYFHQKPDGWRYVCARCLPKSIWGCFTPEMIQDRAMDQSDVLAHLCGEHLQDFSSPPRLEIYENSRYELTCFLSLSETESASVGHAV